MPHLFSICEECYDFSKITNLLNNDAYNNCLEIYKILCIKVPPEIAQHILKIESYFGKCGNCGIVLCKTHKNRALSNSNMCSNCCWFEIG